MAWVSWGQDAESRASGRWRALGPQWPTIEQPKSRWERNAAMVRITWGHYSSLSLSLAHLSYTINITLSRIKCERYIFIKKCVRSFIEVRHYVWLCSAYCIVAIQQKSHWSLCVIFSDRCWVLIIIIIIIIIIIWNLIISSEKKNLTTALNNPTRVDISCDSFQNIM